MLVYRRPEIKHENFLVPTIFSSENFFKWFLFTRFWESFFPAENGSILPFAAVFFVDASNFWFFTFTDPKQIPSSFDQNSLRYPPPPFGLDPVPLRVVQPLEEIKRNFLPWEKYCFLNDVNVTQLRGFNHCFSFHYVRLLFAGDFRIETLVYSSNGWKPPT